MMPYKGELIKTKCNNCGAIVETSFLESSNHCPHCGNILYIECRTPYEYNQNVKIGNYVKMQRQSGRMLFKMAIVLFLIFLITAIYALLNIFIFNNFKMDLFFILGMITIVPSLIFGFIGADMM